MIRPTDGYDGKSRGMAYLSDVAAPDFKKNDQPDSPMNPNKLKHLPADDSLFSSSKGSFPWCRALCAGFAEYKAVVAAANILRV